MAFLGSGVVLTAVVLYFHRSVVAVWDGLGLLGVLANLTMFNSLPNIENVLVSGTQAGNRQVAFGAHWHQKDAPLMTGTATLAY